MMGRMRSKIGFTGTRAGMTDEQKLVFTGWIITNDPYEFHHGDCKGADEEAHNIVRVKINRCRMIGHPPDNDKQRAKCKFEMNYLPAPCLDSQHLNEYVSVKLSIGDRCWHRL